MSSDRDEVYGELVEVFVDRLHVPRDEIRPDSHAFDDLGLDSVDLLSAVAVLERRYAIDVRDEDLPRMLVLRDAADLVAERIGAKVTET